MAHASETDFEPERSHLVSLVLQSEKALQQSQELCSIARARSVESAQVAVDVLGLNAKVRWMTDAVLDQLKMAASVAKIIQQKRVMLESQAKEWDLVRAQRTAALDAVLDSLGSQLVPAEFYSISADPSLFGNQHGSDDEDDEVAGDPEPGQSPTETLRDVLRNGMKRNWKARQKDRNSWKSLRDFVDERAIEDVLDTIENDRNTLDDILAKTSDYPESLVGTIAAIRNSLPTEISIPPMDDIFAAQETASIEMANHLSSLTSHYDQMVQALHECERGEEFSEADLQAMNRDTDELPAIIGDLQKSVSNIDASYGQLVTAKHITQEQLDAHRGILDDLDELGDIISEMLGRQQTVQSESAEQLDLLHASLDTIEELHNRYTSYQYSYCKLVIELARRQQYREAAQKIVEGMMTQLEAMTTEEFQRREDFNARHGEHLPEDVCLCVQNPPTRWEVLPLNHESIETLPDIDQDLLQEALDRAAAVEGVAATSQSL